MKELKYNDTILKRRKIMEEISEHRTANTMKILQENLLISPVYRNGKQFHLQSFAQDWLNISYLRRMGKSILQQNVLIWSLAVTNAQNALGGFDLLAPHIAADCSLSSPFCGSTTHLPMCLLLQGFLEKPAPSEICVVLSVIWFWLQFIFVPATARFVFRLGFLAVNVMKWFCLG